jgi:prepilin-type N-terminal cleavage/methylation domain-containing protein
MGLFNKKFGYTLSEVLITITLIGFLATMTLSTVGSSVQQRTRLAEFRAAYSKMSTALKNVMVDSGRIYACYLAPTTSEITNFGLIMDGTATEIKSGCEEIEKSFVRAMGAVRFCETDPFSEGCLPASYTVGESGCFTDFSGSKAYVLDNSMILITDTKAESLRLFAVDVNGRKGPNKWGQDIFPFSLKATETKTVHGKVFVKSVGILPPSASCKYYVDATIPLKDRPSRTTGEMMKESSGLKIN